MAQHDRRLALKTMEHGSGALTPSERRSVEKVLRADREQTLAQIAGLTRDFNGIVESYEVDPPDDEHDPEGSTIAFERAQVSSLLEHTRRHLAELDDALARLENGTYGVCRSCGRNIALDRLMALPAALTCIGCAAAAESAPWYR